MIFALFQALIARVMGPECAYPDKALASVEGSAAESLAEMGWA